MTVRVIGLSLLLLLMVGCAHKPPQLPLGNWNERQTQLEQIKQWQVNGKLGVRIPGDNGSATLRWLQTNNHYSIDISGPLGSGRVAINGQPGRVSLSQAGAEPITAATAEELILQSTGWTIPVTQLTYWIRALPAPKQKIVHWEVNELDQLSLLEQAGWRVQYSQYQRVTSANNHSVLLPGRVIAEYGEVRLTLIIREWNLTKTSDAAPTRTATETLTP
jgi:outer membrane lipoprotein LolB